LNIYCIFNSRRITKCLYQHLPRLLNFIPTNPYPLQLGQILKQLFFIQSDLINYLPQIVQLLSVRPALRCEIYVLVALCIENIYLVHKGPPLLPTLGNINPVHIATPCLFKDTRFLTCNITSIYKRPSGNL